MARALVLEWFKKLDTTESGLVARGLVESLLQILMGAEAPGPDYLDSFSQKDNQKVEYNSFVNKLFGEFSEEGFRWEDGAWLGGADTTRFLQCDIPKDIGSEQAKLDGTFADLVERAPGLEPQSVNLVKKCVCGKPNAITMANCNACGADLKETAESKTSNLFVGMIFGVAKAPFPLKISLRTEAADIMCFDDPLAITRAHILSVPTDVYCPDIRSLFLNPAKGLALVKKLEEAAWQALKGGPLSDAAWKKKALSPAAQAQEVEALRPRVLKGFNLPPSQYQLHLQYMLPPLLPNHYTLWQKGVHYCKLRHFPCKYVCQALQKFVDEKKDIANATTMTAPELVDAISKLGVDYDAAYKEDMDELATNNQFLANFSAEDFKYVVAGDKVYTKGTQDTAGNPPAKDLEAADKLAMQGYGRPYAGEKPGGVFYKHAREPTKLPDFN